MSVIDDLLTHNAAYSASFAKGELAAPPAREVAVITCMDARIETGRMLGIEEGNAHVIRNAGGIVTDDVIRSLVLSQRLLGTRSVMLIQHTRCGVMNLAEPELRRALFDDCGQTPSFSFCGFPDLEQSVRDSVQRIRTSAFLPHTDDVRGFVYDVESGGLGEIR